MTDTVYEFSAKTIMGLPKSLADYQGAVLLIVNTASKCGLTPQYAGLQQLFEQYHERGFQILGFPCNQFMNQEPGNEEEIQQFCQLNYGVTFPMFAKIDVNGKDTHPLFAYLKEAKPGPLGLGVIKWNFTKFLVDRQGYVRQRFAPQVAPNEIAPEIEALLDEI